MRAANADNSPMQHETGGAGQDFCKVPQVSQARHDCTNLTRTKSDGGGSRGSCGSCSNIRSGCKGGGCRGGTAGVVAAGLCCSCRGGCCRGSSIHPYVGVVAAGVVAVGVVAAGVVAAGADAAAQGEGAP